MPSVQTWNRTNVRMILFTIKARVNSVPSSWLCDLSPFYKCHREFSLSMKLFISALKWCIDGKIIRAEQKEMCDTRVFHLMWNETNIFLLKWIRSNEQFNTAPLWPRLVSISKGLVDFYKFDNFRQFFRKTSAKNYRSDLPMSGKNASQ